MTKDSTHSSLQDLSHPSQLEQKYGGSAANTTKYWPPRHISDEYGHDPDCLLDTDSESEDQNEPTENIDNNVEPVVVTKVVQPEPVLPIYEGVGVENVKVEVPDKVVGATPGKAKPSYKTADPKKKTCGCMIF